MSAPAPSAAVHHEHTHPDFKKNVAIAMANSRMIMAVEKGTSRQDGGRRSAMKEFDDQLGVRDLAARIKDHTLQNLDRYLEQLVTNIEKLGGKVHFAETGEQANEIIEQIARDASAHTIIKSKSMVSEEIELNHHLDAKGFDVVETDLGEYILQIGDEKPSHIVAPVVHKKKEDIAQLFHEKLGIPYTEDPETLTAAARKILREKFKQADMGITGVNFAVAETGTIALVTNEGNGRFCSSRPRVVVSLMGVEKIVPRLKDLALFYKLIGKSGTGQRITCYSAMTTGPKLPDDFDGPEEFHLVILDRGRIKILGSEYRETLRCIRCGACLNACPVYRKIGGHAYESVYPGPIGKLVTPLLNSMTEYENLPQASSLCGACCEACPVRIDIPSMLIKMRNDLVGKKRYPFGYGMSFKMWKLGMQSKFLYHWGAKMFHWFVDSGASNGWNRTLPGPGSGWTDHRDFPAMAEKPFHDRWAELKKQLRKKK